MHALGMVALCRVSYHHIITTHRERGREGGGGGRERERERVREGERERSYSVSACTHARKTICEITKQTL